MKDKYSRFGEIHRTYIEHYNENRTEPGKLRPVMVVTTQEEQCKVIPITGTKSIFNHINGHELKDWQEAGLSKPCFVNCHPKDGRTVSLQDMNYVGRLSLRDREHTFDKLDRVAHKVKAQKQQVKSHSHKNREYGRE